MTRRTSEKNKEENEIDGLVNIFKNIVSNPLKLGENGLVFSETDIPVAWEEQKLLCNMETATENSQRCTVMKTLNKVRYSVITTLLSFVSSKIPGVVYETSGSQNVTSDMDFTLLSKDTLSQANFLDLFNSTFASIFKRSSAEVFDVNLYGASPVVPYKKEKFWTGNKVSCTTAAVLYDNRVYDQPTTLALSYIRQQRKFAMVKLLKYAPDFFEQNCTRFDSFENKNDAPTTLQRDLEDASNLLAEIPTNLSVSDMNTRAVEELRKLATEEGKNETTHLVVNHQLHMVRLFQQEVYFSLGAYAHIVVRNQQDCKAFPIFPNE